MIIVSAPSGSGKSTLINYLMTQFPELEFSISATSRTPRGEEKDGVEYYFLTAEEFRKKIEENAFLEYEEVYKDKFYGTLKSEVSRINDKRHTVIFDVDVVGGCNIKKMYGENALSVFIMPPSIATLKERLLRRGTDAMEVINDRVEKASQEMSYANRFDRIVINDDLDSTKGLMKKIVGEFLKE